jgi:hypothetical protein
MRDLSILPPDFFDFFVGVDFSTFFSSLTLTTKQVSLHPRGIRTGDGTCLRISTCWLPSCRNPKPRALMQRRKRRGRSSESYQHHWLNTKRVQEDSARRYSRLLARCGRMAFPGCTLSHSAAHVPISPLDTTMASISTHMLPCIPVPLTPRSTTLNQRPPFTLSAQKTNAPSAPA